MNEGVNQKPALSSRKRRLGAFIIDHVAITFSMVSIIFLALGPDYMSGEGTGDLTSIMTAVMIPGFLLYFVKDTIRGVSFGKWVMGIMVRDQTNPEEVPSFGRLLFRNLFIIIWPIEFIVLAGSQDKRRLGDKVAKTIVVKNPDNVSKLPKVVALAGGGVVFFIFFFLFVGATLKSSNAYKVAITEIENNQEIQTETGGIKGYGWMPSGSINTSGGSGQATLDITVVGNEKDMSVNVYLTKEENEEWKLVELNK